MNPKIMPGGRGRIPYLLRAAFVAAKQGDREEAIQHWNQAMVEGYIPIPKTKSQLMYAIRLAEEFNMDFAEKLIAESQIPEGEPGPKPQPLIRRDRSNLKE